MDTPSTHVMTIANSIIGVSILAMPYCFKQCGIILSILMLILSSIISRLACHFLLKSAIKARLKTFEFLAYHAFGPFGKFIIEIGMIGFLLGTCIAFFVVMGDLSPQIVSQMIGLKTTNTVRTSVLVILAVFCILPLGLLRNVDSLSGVCTATIGFYMCLVLKIMAESAPHILVGDWYEKVEFWRTEGALQCIPIFSMALFCQTQLFEIYQAIPNASLERMNSLIRIAVNICTSVYIFVGIFGYIALANEPFSGNVLMSFKPSFMTEIMKIGFVLSVAFSFPLIIFPCRASLFSLFYKPTYVLHDSGANFIPEGKFRLLTVVIVFVSLVIGVLIPNIELVLGLVGSTIGVMICVLFPATCFICMSTKNTNERILAQIMLFIGIIVMVLGTYANIYAIEEANLNAITEKADVIPLNVNANIMKSIEEHKIPVLDIPSPVPEVADRNSNKNIEEVNDLAVLKEVRHEPPQPVEPEEVVHEEPKELPKIVEAPENTNVEESEEPKELPKIVEVLEKTNVQEGEKKIVALDGAGVQEEKKEILKPVNTEETLLKNDKVEGQKQPDDQPTEAPVHNSAGSEKLKENAEINRSEQVDIEAIKKEDKEIIQQEKEKDSDYDKHSDLRDQISQLQKQNQVQQQIVQEQKKILEEIKQQQEALRNEQGQNEIDKVKEEKLKAVKEIETIAKQAIKSLVEDREPETEVNAKPAMAISDSNKLKDDTGKETPVELKIVKINANISNADAVKKTQESDTLNFNNKVNLNKTVVAPDVSELQLLLPHNLSSKPNKLIELDKLVPIPIAKSNNISVFANVNLSNHSLKLNASHDEDKKMPLTNQNLESKLVDVLISKVPPGVVSDIKKEEEERVKNQRPNEPLQVDDKKKDESLDETEKKQSKQIDTQAMRRDILQKREKRDADEDKICDKLDASNEQKYQNQYKLDEPIKTNDKIETQKSPDGLLNQNQGEICEKTDDELNLFKSEGNLNPPNLINNDQHDLSKNVLDSSFNIFKNRKK